MIKIDTEVVERIIIALIFLTISLTFILKPEEEVKEEFVINEDSFNIFPFSAGNYFSKIECFCFVEQKRMSWQTREVVRDFGQHPVTPMIG